MTRYVLGMPKTRPDRLLWSSTSRWMLCTVWLVSGGLAVEVRIESWGGLVRGAMRFDTRAGGVDATGRAAIRLASSLRRCRSYGEAAALLAHADLAGVRA